MPQPDKTQEEALRRLDERLEAVEAARARKASGIDHAAMGQGYRFLGELVGGVLGGVGLGWLLDRFAGTGPWGLVGGLLIGTGFSIFVAMRNAAKQTKALVEKAGPLPVLPDDEDED